MEYVGKNESNLYPGFYHVPTLKATLINTNGRVIDLNKNWCPLQRNDFYGYPCINSDNNRRHIHRLLALTFLPEPKEDIKKLDVNHIDGIKSNNNISNLEWATRSENNFHAYQNDLRTDNVKVLVKNVITGEIKKYYSIHECGRALNVRTETVFNHLRDYNYGKISFGKYVLIREGQEWPEIDKSRVGKHRNGYPKPLIFHEVGKDNKFYATCVREACEHLGFSKKALAKHIRLYGDKPYKGYVFIYVE